MFIFIATSMLISQNRFARMFGGANEDWALFVIQTTDGGYAVAGWTYSFGAGYSDLLVLKLNPNSSLSWTRTFGGTSYDYAFSIIQTTDGGYAVAGYTQSFGAGGRDFLALKLNSGGSLAWARTFGGTDLDWAEPIIQTSDGGYVVLGHTRSFGAGYDDILALKLYPDGSLEGALTFGGTEGDYGESVVQTTDGGYAIAGGTYSFGVDSLDLLLIKLMPDYSLEGAMTFGGTKNEQAQYMIQTSDGGYAIAGYTESFGAGDKDFLVIKLNSNYSLAWARTFGGAGHDRAESIVQTSDGGYAIAGYTGSFGAGGDDFLVIKVNSGGSLVWARTFGGTGDEWAESIIQTSDGGYAVAGYTGSFGASNRDFVVLKIDQNGNYPGCVYSCSPTSGTPSMSTSGVSLGAPCSPSTSTPGLTITSPSLTITDACVPVDMEEIDPNGPGSRITCSPVPGGIIFTSFGDMGISIYSADGRRAYSGDLRKGKNRIKLEAGVYIWITSNQQPGSRKQSGRVAVR